MNGNETPKHNSMRRADLGFREEALTAFSFLEELGFVVVESSPTIVKYERGGSLWVNIYHGLQSYEVGFEIFYAEKRYDLSEFMRLVAPIEGEAYRNFVATTAAAVRDGINQVRYLVKKYIKTHLQGDFAIFHALDRQRNEWAEALALKTQVSLLRPRAEEAFRRGCYAQAAELYDKIRETLSPVEMRKADLARERATRAVIK